MSTWENDAKLAGQLDRNHKAYLALLCARCVQVKTGRGRAKNSELSENKASAVQFAKVAGISDKTVTAYLRVWDAMAKAAVVPARADLMPGVDVELPDVATWTKYYRQATAPKPQDAKAPIAEAASTEGSTSEATVTTLATPKVEPNHTSELAAKVSALLLALTDVKPIKTSVAKYDQALAIATELASLVGVAPQANVAEVVQAIQNAATRELQPTG